MERIFIVEDEEKICRELQAALEKNGYETCAADGFADVAGQILREAPDLVLLDINLPARDGFYICREVRKKSDVPIIMVTSSDSDMDELAGLNLGADDFITKPCRLHLLLAHIHAVLNRTKPVKQAAVLRHRGVCLEVLKGSVSYRGKETELTKNELGILKFLMENPGVIISRNDLICRLWDMEEFVEDSTLTVNINRLRRKLSDIGLSGFLITKRGQGYMV